MTIMRQSKKSSAAHGKRQRLRRADQSIVAGLVALSLVGMAGYFVMQGGFRGGLIEIDRATPLEARFCIDINEAQRSEFSQLLEVGETLARRIVDWRMTNGSFK
jgi:DNA uptake protein ComE-like DNA-binding protein